MERAKILRGLMESKGYKVADIVRISGLPYSTVKYIFENGIEKASYSNVQKICAALGVSTDDLESMVAGSSIQSASAPFDTTEYTPAELDRIKEFAAFVKSNRKGDDEENLA
jgi:transcriptional regulator with XRE-family HTH domain